MARYIIIDMDMPDYSANIWVLHTEAALSISPRETDICTLFDESKVYRPPKLKLEECDLVHASRVTGLSKPLNKRTHKYIQIIKEFFNEN